jgi:hypothetical protein
MARSEVRALILAVAGLGVLTNTVGALFALQTGTSLSPWQLNCLGVGLPTGVVGTLAAWHQPRNRIAWLFLSASVGFVSSNSARPSWPIPLRRIGRRQPRTPCFW